MEAALDRPALSSLAARASAAGLLAACVLALPLGAQRARPLDVGEFVVAGVSLGADSVSVLRRLGPPDSVVVDKEATDCGEHSLASWHYRHLTLLLDTQYAVAGFLLTGATATTARGIAPGASRGALRSRYGAPAASRGGEWEFYPDASRSPLLRVRLEQGRVRWIYLGR